MKKEPLVSIIMPSYNTGTLIGESIESVLAQTYQNWELIVVDDCSTDNSVVVIESYRDPRIQCFCNEKNSGAAYSRNRAIGEATGKYIAFLDSDDLWLPDKLEKQILFMEENQYVFTYHKYGFINVHSQKLSGEMSGPKNIKKCGFFLCNWAGCLSVVYNAEIVGVLEIDTSINSEDYAVWLKISKNHPCYLLEEQFAYYRKREKSLSSVNKLKKISWSYHIFRKSEKMNIAFSAVFSMVNVVFVIYKKIRYMRKFS